MVKNPQHTYRAYSLELAINLTKQFQREDIKPKCSQVPPAQLMSNLVAKIWNNPAPRSRALRESERFGGVKRSSLIRKWGSRSALAMAAGPFPCDWSKVLFL